MKTDFNEMVLKLKNITTQGFTKFLEDNGWTYPEFNPLYKQYIADKDAAERKAWIKKEEDKLKVKQSKRKTQ